MSTVATPFARIANARIATGSATHLGSCPRLQLMRFEDRPRTSSTSGTRSGLLKKRRTAKRRLPNVVRRRPLLNARKPQLAKGRSSSSSSSPNVMFVHALVCQTQVTAAIARRRKAEAKGRGRASKEAGSGQTKAVAKAVTGGAPIGTGVERIGKD